MDLLLRPSYTLRYTCVIHTFGETIEIEKEIAYLDEDDKAFIREMFEEKILTDMTRPISLREIANIWYERGYEDQQEDEM